MPEIDTRQVLLEGFFDYAGLYPPASLDMEETVANWVAALDGHWSWMIGRLIVPASRLDEYAAAAAAHGQDEEPWCLSVLLPEAGEDAFERAIGAAMACKVGMVDVVEFKAATPQALETALDLLPDELFPFVEIDITADPRGMLAALAGSVAAAKVRTGGTSGGDYPQLDDLARFVHVCATSGQPFKATAGMHHPTRRHNHATGVLEYGFLGVLLATAAARFRDASEDEVAAILAAEELEDGWLDAWEAQELAVVRSELFCSLGSCSFDEPREDLQALGLLDAP